jgi:transcriptional regulator PpsR
MFGQLDPAAMTALLRGVADISLYVDEDGQVLQAAFGGDDLRSELGGLPGSNWADTVVEDSRAQVAELLQVSGGREGESRVSDIRQRLADGAELPLRCTAVPVPGTACIAVGGRDLRAYAALQQQILNAQMALEQDYWRLRQVESRYRLLFQMAGEPLLILDEASARVLEANPLADELLGTGGKSIVGKVFPIGFDKAGTLTLRELLLEVGALGRATSIAVSTADRSKTFTVSANLLRQGNEARILVRLVGVDDRGSPVSGAADFGGVLQHAPDAVVLTDNEGRIRIANDTFLQLAQLASQEQVNGRSIDRWLGRTGVDLNVLLTNVRQHQAVRLFATKLRSEYGTTTDVEISATAYGAGDESGFAFFIRDIDRRIATEPSMSSRLPKTVEQITQQVGRVPLKELVRQSTDLVEKLCIEAALELTGDNRASAAELLGVSRQGLYAKLHRHNLGEKSDDQP